jgi:glutamyl-Q tRNA(Asp) synthetase
MGPVFSANLARMIVTRFAPSPTGYLHLGHAYAAIAAQGAGQRFLLRIEDLDTTRCRAEFENAIYQDLTWLGLEWELPVLRQSARFAAYRAALNTLDTLGLLYPCFCTRADIAQASEAPHGPEGALYPGTCRNLDRAAREARIAAGAPYALRLDVAKAAARAGALSLEERGAGPNGERGILAADPLAFGDIALARKETPAAYHLAVVVDDAFQGVSLVTRGNDLFAATGVQRLLQTLLGLPAPAYAHHKLILDEQGRKFSKRDKSVTLRAMREAGVTAAEIREKLAAAV